MLFLRIFFYLEKLFDSSAKLFNFIFRKVVYFFANLFIFFVAKDLFFFCKNICFFLCKLMNLIFPLCYISRFVAISPTDPHFRSLTLDN